MIEEKERETTLRPETWKPKSNGEKRVDAWRRKGSSRQVLKHEEETAESCP